MSASVIQNSRQRYGGYLVVASALVLMGSWLVAEAKSLVFGMIQESSAHHDVRMQWWRETRFGNFLHCGLFSAAGCSWWGHNAPWLGGANPVPDRSATLRRSMRDLLIGLLNVEPNDYAPSSSSISRAYTKNPSNPSVPMTKVS